MAKKKTRLSLPKKLTIAGGLILASCLIICWIIFTGVSGGGSLAGTAVGAAIGSLNGVTTGLNSGYEAGTEKGLSAEDTETKINGVLKEKRHLQVLSAEVLITNMNKQGTAYNEMYLAKAEAIFTVDLSKVDIQLNETTKTLNVTVPEPVPTLYLDETETESLISRQTFSLTNAAQHKIINEINSMSKIKTSCQENIANYDSLIEMAKTSAEKQIQNLIEAVSVRGFSVNVAFYSGL